MSLNHGEMSSDSQIENQRSNSCPRLSNSSSISNSNSRRNRNHIWNLWSGPMKIIPRTRSSTSSRNKTKSKQQHRLSGFFQAQLRMMKSSKKGKLSSNNQIISSSSSLVSRKSKKKLTSSCPQLFTSEKSLMPSINYQITTSSSSSSYPILKKHRGKMMTLFDNNSPIHRKMPQNQLGMHDLPEELLAEILKLLPVKYILRCRCVQKSWYYLVKSPIFITLQLNYQKKNIITTTPNHQYQHPKYLYFENAYTDVLTLRFDDIQCQEYCTPKNLPGLPDHAWRAVSYGLICLSNTLWLSPDATPEIYLWNPLVQKYKTLPDSPVPFTPFPETKWKALAFGFVPEINDYVVVHIAKPRLHLGHGEPNPHSVIIGVYSLNTNSWKILSRDNVFVRRISYDDVVFINGAAFWAGVSLDKRRIVVCFDTKTDILREISFPNWVSDSADIPIIHLFGQSIAYFIWDDGYDYFDMWVLNYVSVNEFSWEKKMSISPNEDIRVEVLGVRNNGDPILARSYNLISYNLDNHEAKNFVDSWDSWTPYPYYEEGFAPPFFISPFVESLVLLNID